jgi:GTP cyclohydrolase I
MKSPAAASPTEGPVGASVSTRSVRTREAADAVARFLDALGIPRHVLSTPEIAATPRRVAEAWLRDLVDGYGREAGQILGETMRKRGSDLVVLTGIDFHAVCPHHLLPYQGIAHVAYLPNGKVVGFGQIARLVDCFAHRLVIEEDLARQVAEALVTHLGARGAACVLEAEQLCLTVRGERRRGARAHAQCFIGLLETDAGLQRRFLALAKGGSRRVEGKTRKGVARLAPRPRLRKLA